MGAPLVPGHLWSFLGLQVLGRREYAASFQAPAPPTDQHDERAVAHVEASLGGLKLDGFYIPIAADRREGLRCATSPEATANIRTANDIGRPARRSRLVPGTLFDLVRRIPNDPRSGSPGAQHARRSAGAVKPRHGRDLKEHNELPFGTSTRHIASGTLSHSLGGFLGGRHAAGGGFENSRRN